jgi:ornithine cyclodeaminase
MRFVSAAEIDAVLSFPAMVETLRTAFRDGAVQPTRHHHTVTRASGTPSTLLLMPAWSDFSQGGEGFVGVKVVTVSPDNNLAAKPAVMGSYMLLHGVTCEPLAIMDGQRLTLWRTAAASALASTYLSRKDSRKLLIVGAGALSAFLARAHSAVRPIDEIRVWNRTPDNARKVAAELAAGGLTATVERDLDAGVGWADIVSAATISTVPLVRGAALRPGTHVDLVGAFSPAMRESDDAAVGKSRVYVDTRDGALKEAGDIVQAIAEGALKPGEIRGDLYDLTRGKAAGRGSDSEITLFKSVGAAIEDLAAGVAVWKALNAERHA